MDVTTSMPASTPPPLWSECRSTLFPVYAASRTPQATVAYWQVGEKIEAQKNSLCKYGISEANQTDFDPKIKQNGVNDLNFSIYGVNFSIYIQNTPIFFTPFAVFLSENQKKWCAHLPPNGKGEPSPSPSHTSPSGREGCVCVFVKPDSLRVSNTI
jgi:hypothetical protein